MKTHFAAVLLFAVALSVSAGESHGEAGGKLRLADANVTLGPGLFLPGWNLRYPTGGYAPDDEGSYSFRFDCGDGGRLDGKAVFKPKDTGVEATWTFVPDRDLAVDSLYASAEFPLSDHRGAVAVCDGREVPFPDERPDNPGFFYGKVSRVVLRDASGTERLVFGFGQPTGILLQDNRRWGGATVSLRMEIAAGTLSAGRPYAGTVAVSGPGVGRFVPAEKVVVQAGDEWIPVVVAPGVQPGSALDFSSVVPQDAPAGKYGYAVARGQSFEFEKKPGTPQRFYGVNLCFGANFIDRGSAKRLAADLARIGYNAVRFHHHDGGLVQGSADGTTLNPAQIDRFDGLAAACIEEGLYLTTDLFVSRSVPYRVCGIDRDGMVPMDDMKVLVQFHEGAFSNYLAFARNFFGHVNPYTGRSYAEEPALSFLALVNEGNLGNHGTGLFRTVPELGDAWRAWLAERKAADPSGYGDVPDDLPANLWDPAAPGVAAFVEFLRAREERFAERVTSFLRNEMHCRALLTNMSSWFFPMAYQYSRARSYDYVDDHFYVDHPQFLERPWQLPSSCPNANPMLGESMGAQGLVVRRLLDRPFTITEYNYSAPGRFRGVGGIATGAAGALQNWAGLWRFAWSHDALGCTDPSKKPMSYFDVSGDPLVLASERASICLYLRRDLPELGRTLGFSLPENLPSRTAAMQCRMSWTWASWYAKTGCTIGDLPEGTLSAGTAAEAAAKGAGDIRALLGDAKMGDGALSIDSKTGTFLIRTDRTCGGFAEGGRIEAGPLTAELAGAPATVWASALDDRPLADSARILLTHLTDVQNTGATYADRDRRVLLASGTVPHLMARGSAAVSLRLSSGAFRVYALATDGARRGPVASTWADGVLSFTADVAADPASATFLYEIVRE